MDEPFSALDVLTAETLRTDFLDLWGEGQLPIKGVILVTHNIEEAVLMCDRILVFSTNPGRIVTEIKVDLPQPRDRLDPTFRDLVERIYVEMTARPAGAKAAARTGAFSRAPASARCLPHVSTNLLAGPDRGRGRCRPTTARPTCPRSRRRLHMEIDDLFPVAETLQMLRFAEIEGGDIRLTDAGQGASRRPDVDERKRVFARHLLTYVPLAAHIRRVLDERADPHARRAAASWTSWRIT